LLNDSPKLFSYLRTFGEMAVTTVNSGGIRGKLDDRGQVAMFVGYSDDHPEKTYRLVNVKTLRVIMSRDLKWLGIMWGAYKLRNVKNDNKQSESNVMDNEDGKVLDDE
jgi:hypothetical protein